MIKRISHLGIAVNDLDAAVRLYRGVLGLAPAHRWVAEADRMEACSFVLPGGVELELMRPLEADSPVGKFIAKRGEGIHHIAFKVDDVGGALRRVQADGLETIDKAPRTGGGGKTLVGFLHPRSTGGVLMELEQDVQPQ